MGDSPSSHQSHLASAGSVDVHFTAKGLKTLSPDDVDRLVYSTAMAFYGALDVSKDGDKKTPATHFEILVAHVFALLLGCLPSTSIQVLGEGGDLPTDYIFDLGTGKNKIHLPVKASTRERVIQVWAHQRVIDGVFGVGTYKGVLIVLNETKLDRKALSVMEICVPDQWRLYQKFIAQMHRVYYLDPPAAYLALSPTIAVKRFGQLCGELDQIVGTI